VPPLTPQGENLRQALAWIADELQANPQAKKLELIEEASKRYDLSPAEEQSLIAILATPAPPG
jgi:hypothetical protein